MLCSSSYFVFSNCIGSSLLYFISQVTTLSKVTLELGMEKEVLVEEQDDETYSGLAVYQIFGDHSLLPSQVC